MIMTSLKCYTVEDPKIQKCHFSKEYDQCNKVVICSKTTKVDNASTIDTDCHKQVYDL